MVAAATMSRSLCDAELSIPLHDRDDGNCNVCGEELEKEEEA
jgi:hypothetical protein